MNGKRQLIAFVMLVALTVFGVVNLDTVRLSAYESPAIYISPAYVNTEDPESAIGTNYTFSVYTDYNGSDVYGYEFDLTYNPLVLQVVEVVNGDLITEDNGTILWDDGDFNNTEGTLIGVRNGFYYTTLPPPLVSGAGTLANVTFTVVSCGISNITFVESETRLIGYDPLHPRANQEGFYNIIDQYFPDFGHIEGSVFDNSAMHDVAIIDVTPNQTVVAQGTDLGINVTAQNQGEIAENFTVTAYANTTVIQTENITNLADGTSTTLTFTWNTTGVPLGSYVLSANASTVTDETDTADNSYIDGTVTVASLDLAVTDVVPWKNNCPVPVTQGYPAWTVNINVTVLNNGASPATFTVSAYANETLIGTQPVNDLPAGQNTTLTFSWPLTGVPLGPYTLKANATLVGDTNPGDNEFIFGQFLVKLDGDVNGNRVVESTDLVFGFAPAYGSFPTDLNWNCQADFNDSNSVESTDLIFGLAPNYGQSY